jgi:hypothetical protein
MKGDLVTSPPFVVFNNLFPSRSIANGVEWRGLP